jgi:hypothetical protein
MVFQPALLFCALSGQSFHTPITDAAIEVECTHVSDRIIKIEWIVHWNLVISVARK